MMKVIRIILQAIILAFGGLVLLAAISDPKRDWIAIVGLAAFITILLAMTYWLKEQTDDRLTPFHMKWFLGLVIALNHFAAYGAWIDQAGKPIPDAESMRSAGDFGVQILLTSDERLFRQTWDSSRTPPKLRTTKSVRLGESISALIVFHGCKPNTKGRAT